MPTYEYESTKYGVAFDTTQRIVDNSFKTLKELKEHMLLNGDLTVDQLDQIKNDHEKASSDNIILEFNKNPDSLTDEQLDHYEGCCYAISLHECLSDEESDVSRVITGGVGVIFKGIGWPSQTFKSMKYTGKNKKQVERMREERAQKSRSGLSTPELAAEMGVQGKVTDNVIPNAHWDAFSNSDRAKLRKIGARPSRDYT